MWSVRVYDYSPDGVAAAYRNDVRQLHVNRVADHVGAGIGTGRFYGVPGTGHNFGYYPGYYPPYPAPYSGYAHNDYYKV